MLYVLIGLIVGIILFRDKDEEDLVKKIENYFTGIVFGMTSGFLVWFFAGLYVENLLPKEDFVQEYQLSALGDSEVPNYVTVTHDGNWKYYTFMTNTSSGKIIEKKLLRNVDIIEGDCDPTVKYHNIKLKEKWYYLVAHDFRSEYEYTEFFIPSDGIRTVKN